MFSKGLRADGHFGSHHYAAGAGVRLTLVLGGAASGKSDFAENLCNRMGLERIYVATAQAWDDEMAAKISRHREARGDGWRTIEAPMDLGGALTAARPDAVVLIDCLTLWLTNRMLADQDTGADADALCAALAARAGPVVCVSNEVGQGIVPDTPLGRRFREAQGRLNRKVAALADTVVLVAAGLPLPLKGSVPT